ncbi:MAG: TonB C-terminal domain-containing protein [Gammaproteobacteria bacterium]|nr:TonB C-terminal domain-containing protein [Gammaproteobacteria bacterium]
MKDKTKDKTLKICFVGAVFVHILFLLVGRGGSKTSETHLNSLPPPLKVEWVYLSPHPKPLPQAGEGAIKKIPYSSLSNFISSDSALTLESDLQNYKLHPFPLTPYHLLYLDYWKKKVEKIGRFNYPEKAKFLRSPPIDLLVTLGQDGRVVHTTFLQSSGDGVIDQVILNTVQLASPFLPPPRSMQKKGLEGIEILTHWTLTTTAFNTHMEFVDARRSKIY